MGCKLGFKSSVVVGLLAGMAILLLPLVSEGNALPLASFTYFCPGAGASNATQPGSATCDFSQGSGQVITTADLMAGAKASASSTTSFAMDGTATILYWAEVVGPSNVTVPLLISSFGSASASGTGSAGAALFFPGGNVVGACADPSFPSNCKGAPTSWNTILPFSVLSDVQFNISETADAGAVDPSGSASATVDPTIVIDPSFATGSQFSLLFSSNISPPNAVVPEPGTLTLVALGVGGGSLARRRRRANAT
jgi:PEP-CTERM motif